MHSGESHRTRISPGTVAAVQFALSTFHSGYAPLRVPTTNAIASVLVNYRSAMGKLFVVLSQPIHAVVIAIWRTYDRVNMEWFRLCIIKKHPGVVVKLD
jgi:hypothetical protein